MKREKDQRYLYLLRCGTRYKIGFAKDTYLRIKQLELGSTERIWREHELLTPNYRKIEADLHQRFRARRKHREWFDLLPEDVEYIKSLDVNGRERGLT